MLHTVLEFRRLLRNRTLPPAALEALAERKLLSVIRHAIDNVPYYRALFDRAGLSPDDIRGLADLARIPLTTKDDLRQAGLEACVARGVDLESCRTIFTSGTTSEPFKVLCSRRESLTRWLVNLRDFLTMGLRPRDRVVTLGPSGWTSRKMFYEYLGFYRIGRVSMDLPMDEQIARLKALNPTVIFTLPTALRILLRALDYRLSTVARPRAIVTSLEILDGVLRKRILDDLDTELFDFYGALEVGRIACECPAHSGLHVNADQVIVECLEDGAPAPPGQPGVVVLTSLNQRTMPFIRYRLADRSAFVGKACPCGVTFPLIEHPQGRESEILKLPGGRWLTRLGIDHVLGRLDGVHQYRIIQEAVDHLVLQVAFDRPPASDAIEEARLDILRRLGAPVKLEIVTVEGFNREGLKFRSCISKLT